jgi:uncharacterized membrane protein (TIGR02234 family)
MNRRSYALTLVACLAGAALAAYAVTRTWSLQVTPRTGMSDLRTARTGADAEPWVVGLALVALAGTGALLATRGVVRRVLGGLLALAGAGVAAGAIVGRAGLDAGSAGAGAVVWPAVAVAGGVLVALGGAAAARLGHRWPTMSARYDRKPIAASSAQPVAPAPRAASPSASNAPGDQTPAGKPVGGRAVESEALEPADHRLVWEALDRGEDPTA